MATIIILLISSLLVLDSFSLYLIVVPLIYLVLIKREFINLLVGDWYRLNTFNLSLIILRLWLTLIIYIRIGEAKNKRGNLIVGLLVTILLILRLSFRVNNMLVFFILFESSLVPTLILIIGWGYQPERLRAGAYIMIYTIFASLPLLVILINLQNSSLCLTLEFLSEGRGGLNLIIFRLSMIVFLVKLPVFIFHLWLPKAHVEAPVEGSMVLAGVLLKLGGYGAYLIVSIYQAKVIGWRWLFIVFSIWGGVIARVLCIRQTDLKALIALSSVAHISVVIAGIVSSTKLGVRGSFIVMVGHGLCSPALFFLAYLSYKNSGRRRVFLNCGTLVVSPFLTLIWFLLVTSNIRAPPSLNLLGEVLLITTLVRFRVVVAIFIGVLVFITGVYSLYLYKLVNHGKFDWVFICNPETIKNLLISISLWGPLNYLILGVRSI